MILTMTGIMDAQNSACHPEQDINSNINQLHSTIKRKIIYFKRIVPGRSSLPFTLRSKNNTNDAHNTGLSIT